MVKTPKFSLKHRHQGELHASSGINAKLNWLRAGVLGANDGIVSVAAIVVGVAGATPAVAPILTAGLAGVIGGAVSMALGEYVSVSSQRDTEKALIAKEKWELENLPDDELHELAGLYEEQGLSPETSLVVAKELTAHDALKAHLSTELGIDENDLVSPWHAAGASAIAFLAGSLLPMLSILLPPPAWRVPTTFVAVLVALAITGSISAKLGGAPAVRAVVRVVVGGFLALIATYVIGLLLGASGVA